MENHFISGTDRQIQILQYIQAQHRISVAEICSVFTVSEATARRDLETLANHGKVQRVHGGAISLVQPSSELPILQRQNEQTREKTRIGQAAASLIKDGETIFLGSGTTVLETARCLRQHRNLTVITNSLPVINVLASLDEITVICLGGMLRTSELSFIGHITEQALTEVRADKVIIGIRAISLEHGLTHEHPPETMTDRSILKTGREIIVLADHTKFGRSAAVLLASIEDVHTIITDEDAPSDFILALRDREIRVLQV